jgi:hypothetical protein
VQLGSKRRRVRDLGRFLPHNPWIGQIMAGRPRRQDALDSICEAIANASGDGEPVLSFDPPEPIDSGDGPHAHPDWLFLGVNGWLQADTERSELFSQGLCEHCGAPRGERTEIPIVARSPGEGDLCSPALIKSVHTSDILAEIHGGTQQRGTRWITLDSGDGSAAHPEKVL